MVILIRVLLLLLPVVGLLFWIRARARKNAGGEMSDEDVRHLRFGLIGLVVLILVAGIGIRMTENSGTEGEFYVPARVENGKTIPGHFVDEDPKKAKSEDDADKTPEGNEDSDDAPG